MKTKADVDMSPKAVNGRIEMIRSLYKLCMALKEAGKASEAVRQPSKTEYNGGR